MKTSPLTLNRSPRVARQTRDELKEMEAPAPAPEARAPASADSTKTFTEVGAKVTTVATGTDASAVAPVEPADPADFPAYHPRADDAYTSYNSVNRLLKRGDVALVRGEFLLDHDSPIPARQNMPKGHFLRRGSTFGGPLELKLHKVASCEVGMMTVIAISYTWNQTWIDGECLEAHPDPAMYYLGIVRKVLRFMLKTNEYSGKQAYLFWDWMSRFQDYGGSLIDKAVITEVMTSMVARCMDTMDLWYGSALMMIWMLTQGPPGSRDYFSRGWCVVACAPCRFALVSNAPLVSRSR